MLGYRTFVHVFNFLIVSSFLLKKTSAGCVMSHENEVFVTGLQCDSLSSKHTKGEQGLLYSL